MSSLGNKAIMAKNLKYYMELHGKTRQDMCKDLGVSYTTFSDWYNGYKYPRIDKIQMIANYFNIPKSYLIEDSHTSPDLMKLAKEAVFNVKLEEYISQMNDNQKNLLLKIAESIVSDNTDKNTT